MRENHGLLITQPEHLFSTPRLGYHFQIPQNKIQFRCQRCNNLYNHPNDSLFNIQLQHSFTPRQLNIRFQSPQSTGPFRCHRCNNVYNHRTSLLRHVRQECGKEPQFECPICGHRSKLHCNLLKHIRKCQLKTICTDMWTFRLKKTGNLTGLQGENAYFYQNAVSDARNMLYASGVESGGSSTNLNVLEQQVTLLLRGEQSVPHISSGGVWATDKARKATGFGSFLCPGCGKVYRWRKNMISHMRLECGKEPQFQCPHCPQSNA
ncbi:hypothetical protein C0J52_13331 [Blattella germanica]|nr:hypothetical protein C0J52_13331 [Blattella germanica]